ncbi:tetratricopeptide repeat protein [Acanthopleuribacter pedis]|uniref:DUF3857 domain-containing protein n=1 Tax=Acanthopleuribacter pedis TaxID=442870 RepID=A0A8J7U228_9BACT|nr:hypothetical protein [Acanthopleuribacter pedis]MBO1316858.1 hypothetical protein [Acanthopleuribacter pedis]
MVLRKMTLLAGLCLVLTLAAPLAAADLEAAWNKLAKDNDPEAARVLFAEGRKAGDHQFAIGWFLTFSGQGPTEELNRAALTILREDPTSPAAEWVLKWMSQYRDCLPNWGNDVAQIIADARPGNAELMVRYANMNRFASRNRKEEPAFGAIAQRAAFLTEWKISENFGNYPIPAFDKKHPAEEARYWNNEALNYRSRTGVVLPPRHASGAGVIYGFGRFGNPVEQEVTFRVFSYHNIAVYLDGVRVAQFNMLEEYGPNIRFFKVKLPAGEHEVLVKSTQTRGNNGQFSVQVTGKQPVSLLKPGNPVHDLSDKVQTAETIQVGLAAAIADETSDFAAFQRAFLAILDKDKATSLKLLEDLYESYDGSLLIGTLLSEVYLGAVKFLPPNDQISRAYQILASFLQAPDYNQQAMYSLALLLNRHNQTKDALVLLNRIVEINPGFCEALDALLAISNNEKLLDVRQKALGLLNDMGPANRWAQQELLKETRRDGDLGRTKEILANLAELLPWEGFQAQLHEMNEEFELAIKDLESRGKVFDDRAYYPYAVSQGYAKLGKINEQRVWLEKALEIDPTHEDAILDLVNLSGFQGKMDEAKQILRDYLRIEPANSAFRQRLSHLEGRTAFEAYRVDSAEIIAEAKNKPISEGANSELLLDQLMVRLFPDGSQMRYTHLVSRVLTKDGVDSESEIRLPGEDIEILELRTIKQDGSVLYPESFEHKSTISLSGVSVGDFIDEEHIEYLPPAYYDSDGLDSFMTFIFQGVDRIYHHSELVLIYPEDLQPEPALLSRNMPEGQPTVEVKNGLKYVRWLTKDMPPLTVEPSMPPANYSQPVASFYFNTDWEEIRDFYTHATRQRLGVVNRLKPQIEAWRQLDLEPRALAERIYRDITERIDQDGPFYQDVNLTWESRAGNATLLVAAVYRELGIKHDIVLTRPERIRHYTFDTPLPSLSYSLLRLPFEDGDVWLDANQAGLPFGYVPFPFRGSTGIVLDGGERLWIDIPAFEDRLDRVASRYEFHFAADGKVEATGAETFYGQTAARLSENWKQLNRPEIMQRVEAGINQNFPGAVVSETGENDELPPGEFEINYSFKHDSLAKPNDSGFDIEFLLPKTPLLNRYGSLPDRKTPILIAQPHFNVANETLHLPEGMRWEVTPRKIVKESDFGTYSLSITPESDQVLKVKREYHVPAQFVMPEAYQEFLVFCKTMVENEDLTFKAVKDVGAP